MASNDCKCLQMIANVCKWLQMTAKIELKSVKIDVDVLRVVKKDLSSGVLARCQVHKGVLHCSWNIDLYCILDAVTTGIT